MAIKTHENRRYNSSNNLEHSIPAKVLHCDFCGRECGAGRTPGDADEAARKNGARPVPGKSIADPMKWACVDCSKKLAS